ncbi:MAG: hypothetical protein JNG88_17750 [Phycisphaerales bacterium]|nr:hypothetical protein [Phycisphaerales bacterium]
MMANGEPADIASLTIDPSSSTENFVVTLANGSAPGANNVGTIELAAPSWTGYSSIAGFSYLAGNLAGDLTVAKNTGGDGGHVQMIVGHDAGSDSTITIPGEVSLWIGEPSPIGEATGTLEGTLNLPNSIALGSFVNIGTLAGTIDLNDAEMNGALNIAHGGAGQIVNGGTIRGVHPDSAVVVLSVSVDSFSGSAAFAQIDLGGSVTASMLHGQLYVEGDVDGTILTAGRAFC